MAERELGIVIRAKDLASRTIANVNRQLGNIGSNVSRGLSNAVRNVERGIAAAAVGLAGLSVYSLRAAGDLEAQMNTINTLIHATPDALGEIEGSIRQMAKDTGTPLADLTGAYYDLLSAGVKAADAQGVLDAANRVAIGGLGTTSDGVNLLTTALNVYGGGAREAADYADYFAQSVAGGVVTIDEIAASFANVGPMAKALGIEIQEVAAGYAQLTAKGETGASASTAMAAALLALQRVTGPMEKAQSDLNVSFAQMADEKGLAYTYQQLVKYSHDYGVPLIDLVGRQEALAYAYAVSGDNAGSYATQLDAVTKATDGQGVAQAQMNERQKGLNFQIGRLKALATDAAITIGQRLLPMVVPMFEKLNAFISENQEGISKFATDLASGFEKAAAWVMGIDWSTITNSLKAAAGFARNIGEAFLGLPSWIQVAVVTGWGLNKLTGGALGSILGGLRGSTAMTPMYVKEVGLGRGVGPPGPNQTGAGPMGWFVRALAVATGAAIGYEIAGPEFERQLAGGRDFMASQRDSLLTSGSPAQLRAALLGLDQTIGELRDGVDPEALMYTFDIGGLKTEIQTTREAIVARLAALERGETPPMGPPRPPGLSGFGFTEAQAMIAKIKSLTTLPDTAVLNKDSFAAVLPDTAMRPVTDAVGVVATKVERLPPILDKAAGILQKVAGIGERQQGQLAEQARRLGSIEGISSRSAGYAAISAAKNFSPTINVPVKVDNHISIHEWQRTVQSSARAYSPTAPTPI